MRRVVIDIETVGRDFDLYDDITKEDILSKITAPPGTAEYDEQLARMTQDLQFSPLVGEIIMIGAYDIERGTGVISYQDPGAEVTESTKDGITYKVRSEKSMLEAFWGGIVEYDECITFNGRGFDIPYLIARSGVQKVHVTRDLMSNRYNNRSWGGMLHIDLYDQLKYYGSVQRAGSLHLWTQAFGIETPKGGGIAGKDVGQAFKDGRGLEIAEYNARDLIATAKVYERWKEYMQPR
jgi:DNA polymerase elongation subunit (family B)